MSLIAWLPLADNTRDMFGHNTTSLGTLPTQGDKTCILGTGYTFSGSSIKVEDLKIKERMSFALWVRMTTAGSYHILDFRNSSGAGYQPMYYGSGSGIQFHSSASSSEYIPCTLTVNKWHHLVVTIKHDGKATLWQDGVNKGSTSVTFKAPGIESGSTEGIISYLAIGSRCSNENNFKGNIQDVRVYDHILSKKEIRELAKGIIFDLDMENSHIESVSNYAPIPEYTGDYNITSWDVDLHSRAIRVPSWSLGYNGGVTSPEIGYHARWQLIDGIPTMVFNDINNQFGLNHRWLGISGSTSSLKTKVIKGAKYTISFEAMGDTDGLKISTGIHYNNGSSENFHDTLYHQTITRTWKRYSVTKTVSATTTNNPSVYFYGHYNDTNIQGTSYVRNVKVEFNDHATGYVEYSNMYDSSGRGILATFDDITTSTNTNLGLRSIYFNGETSFIQIPTFKSSLVSSPFTFSFWVNPSESGTRDIYFADYGTAVSGISGQVNFNIERTAGNLLRIYYNSDTPVGSISNFTIPSGSWTHVCITYDGSTLNAYKNGTSVYTKTNLTTSLSKTSGYWRIGSDFRAANGSYDSEKTRFKGYMSDFKIYGTALSSDDVANIYKTRVQVAKGEKYGRLFVNNLNETGDVQNAVFDYKMNANVNSISEYNIGNKFDGNIYFEPDGSAWVKVAHHGSPASGVFSSSADFKNSVYQDSNRWFNGEVFDKFDIGRYELLIKQKQTRDVAEKKYRWIQLSNPMEATYSNVVKGNIIKPYSGSTLRYRLPSEYQEVEYIESDGVAYIDTGWSSSKPYQIDCDMEIIGNVVSNYWFGQQQANGSMMYNGLYSSSALEFNWKTVSRASNTRCRMTQTLSSDRNTTTITMNGTSTSVATGTNGGSGNFYIFACNGGTRPFGSRLRLYMFKIHTGSAVVRNFIPCYRKIDGAVGLYDLATRKFYENDASSGSFSKGNIITHDGNYTDTTYGGIYRNTDGKTYLSANNGTEGTWWGAIGCYTAYSGGIPGWNGEIVTTGYLDLYLRIDGHDMRRK